ncbi:MAG: DUF3373 family protein [Arcobacteraceae bacterium]|nr:DUF3373 family protein [Arcobacteraceae bacterium]
MNKKIILSTALVSTLFAINLSAVSTEDRITALENEIKALKTGKANSKMVNEMDERLETVETRTIVDRISLGLGMRVEMNNMSTTYANGTSPANEDPIFRTKLNLNMKSDIADNLKFTGRLSSYKNWGDSNYDQMTMANMDAKQGRTPDNSSALYVERAYLDWALNNGSDYPMFLTIGRQPSSDGPSYQIKEGTTRKGTYDALAFDGAADGIVFTANLDKALPGTTSLRFAYGTPNNGSTYNSTTMKDTKVSGIFLDKTCSLLNADHLIQIYAVNAKDLMANPSLANPTTGASLDKNIGDLGLYGAMFEVQNVAGFDFFAHYAHSTAKPNGNTVDLSAMGYGTTEGLLSSSSTTSEATGHAIWVGTQYSMADWSVGAEYNQGSQNWFSFTFSPNDPINKLAARGDAKEVYVAKKINKYANIRLGYVDINYDYTGSGSWLGAPMDITNPFAATQVKESKNTYLTFNVLF